MPDSVDSTKSRVRAKYSEIAASQSSCCAPSASEGAKGHAQGEVLSGCAPSASTTCLDMSERYDTLDGYADDADLGLGCGLPTEMADLQSGERVIDLGSGAGLDAFVARRAVGAEGYVLGVDMTPEMIKKARANAAKLGYGNVDFRLGEVGALPVDDGAFDVALSNCVLNLVPDKTQAFREMMRALRPGGRFVISDIVSTGLLPDAIREAAELYVGCIAGALPKGDYLDIIRDVGFEHVTVEKDRPIELPDEMLREHLSDDALADFRASGAGVCSVTVTGVKPGA